MSDEPEIVQWFCVRTQTKREHIAANHLKELEGVLPFCPRMRYRKTTRRGRIWWVEALFPGYLLAKFCLKTHERAVTYCPGVRGLVRFGSETPPVADNFVEALKYEVLRAQDKSETELLEDTLTVNQVVEKGEEIEMATGPLTGFHGTVVEVLPGKERVKVLLEFLGQERVMEVDFFSLLLPRKPLP